jgi:hypothetical protein
MLAKSSKSRFFALALMALGLTTFMGTSAALAEGVNVGGSVACEASSASLSVAGGATIAFGTLRPGWPSVSRSVGCTLTQAKNTDCEQVGSATVSASRTAFDGARLGVSLGGPHIFSSHVRMEAFAPSGATPGSFTGTLTLRIAG